MTDCLSVSPASLTTVMLDFLPKGGLVTTTSKCSLGSLRSASSVLIGGSCSSSSGPIPCRSMFIAQSRVVGQMALLVEVEIVMGCEVVVRREQEAACAAGWIADHVAGSRPDAIHQRVDQHSRREILSRSTLGVFGVLLKQALVSVALYVGRHRGPVLLA